MPRAIRREFTDLQKAEIFVRDRAICAFCGRSLWVLDYGADPSYTIDWIDHIKPISRGGLSEVDNGVCACYFCNSKKRNNGCDNRYLFRDGKPTDYFFWHQDAVSADIAANIRRFGELVRSDWFFNRVLYRVLCGLDWFRVRKLGFDYMRDDAYYAKSAFKILCVWQKLVMCEQEFEVRGLVSSDQSEDQKIMLSLRDAKSERDVIDAIHSLKPYYLANDKALGALRRVSNVTPAQALAHKLRQWPFVTAPVRHKILLNLHRLYDIRLH